MVAEFAFISPFILPVCSTISVPLVFILPTTVPAMRISFSKSIVPSIKVEVLKCVSSLLDFEDILKPLGKLDCNIVNFILTPMKYSLLLVIFFAAACSNKPISQEAEFVPEMLGIVPGSTVAELNFAWYSGEGEKSFVRIFEAGKLMATERGISGAASEGKYFHKATAKNLKPNTEYTYSVSSDSSKWSVGYKFKTPHTESFKFAVVGDPQLSTDESIYVNWKTTVEKIEAAGASFILSLGDQVDEPSNEKQYENLFAPPALKSISLAPTLGSHDKHQIFNFHFNLPNVQPYENYFYLYNNVLFVALNTADYVSNVEEAKPYIESFDAAISTAKAMYSGKYKWLIVHHHKSTRSIASHFADADIKSYVEAGFEALMDKHNVDFVLAGHDHIYVRSGKYMTFTTSSGLKYYDVYNDSLIATVDKYAQHKTPSYGIFEVKGDSISVSVYDVGNDVPIDKKNGLKVGHDPTLEP